MESKAKVAKMKRNTSVFFFGSLHVRAAKGEELSALSSMFMSVHSILLVLSMNSFVVYIKYVASSVSIRMIFLKWSDL